MYILKNHFKKIIINKGYMKYTLKSFSLLNLKKNQVKAFVAEELINKELNKISNINSLILMLDCKNDSFFANEENFLAVVNKFRELEDKEPNCHFKVYNFLDFILYKPQDLSLSMIKSLLGLYISNKVQAKAYWDFICDAIHHTKLLQSEEFLDHDKENVIDLIKAFSLISYDNSILWNQFENIVKNKLDLNKEERQSIILSFCSKEKGDEEFIEDLIEQSKDESDSDEIIINYAMCLTNHFRNFDIYHKIFNYSFDYVIDKIEKNNDLAFSILPGYYKLLYKVKSYKKTNRYDKEKLENFVLNLEKRIATAALKKRKDDFDGIANLIQISKTLNFKLRYLKKKILLNYFLNTISNDVKYSSFLTFLEFFEEKKLERKKIETKVNDQTWENLIDQIHLFEVKDLILLFKLMKYFKFEYFRIWIFLQNRIQKELSITYSGFTEKIVADSTEKLISKLNYLKQIYLLLKDDNFFLADEILLPFNLFVEKELEKIQILLSWKDIKI